MCRKKLGKTNGSRTGSIVLTALSLIAFALSSRAVVVGWDASSGASGYKLYYGTTSSNYTSIVDATGNTTNRVSGLQIGTRYYFAVSAYNSVGESAPSAEISYVVTNVAPTLVAPLSVATTKETSKALTGISIVDPDGTNGTYVLTLRTTYGRVQITTSIAGGVTSGQVSGNGSTNVQLTARLAAVNATLGAANGVAYTGGLNFVGTDTLALTARDNAAAQTGSASVSIVVSGNAQDNWLVSFFSYSDLSDPTKQATVWGDSADPDADGQDNLFEFAVGLNPTNREPTDVAVTSTVIDVSGTKYAGLSFNRRKNPAPLQYIPEVSADKTSWTSGSGSVRENSVQSLDATFERVNCQDLTPITAGVPRFIRLRVVKP
jgi:hypothetical protein